MKGMIIMLTKAQLNEFKSNLIQRQNELIAHMDDRYGLTESTRDSISELSMYDNHPADIGTETYERGKDIALNEHAEKELEEINKAIHAIEEGTYGVCRECSMDISYAVFCLKKEIAVEMGKGAGGSQALRESRSWT